MSHASFPRPRQPRPSAPPARQRGWAALLGVLLTLAVVGWLAKDAITGYLHPAAAHSGSAAKAKPDPATALSAGAPPLERARAVESFVQQQAQQRMPDPASER